MPTDRRLDDWIESYVKYTSSSESPEIFRRWTAISTVAAALERKVWLEIGLETFYPNLYIILVGPSGSRKGTAMKPAKRIMDEVGINLAPETTTKEALAKQLAESIKLEDQSEEEIGMDFIQHCSMTIYNEELAVLFKHNDPDLIMWLTNWHDCQDNWKRDTKTQGSTRVEGVWVNLIGAMTPELVKAYMPETAIGGGLTGRIIFVYSAKKGEVKPLPFANEGDDELEKDLIHDLELIHSMRGPMKMRDGGDEDFIEPWVEWVYDQEEKELFQEPNLDPYVNRRRAHMLKLCMILRASRGGEMVLTRSIFEAARSVLRRVERDMPRVFSGVGTSRSARLLSDIAEYIGRNAPVKHQDLVGRFYKEIDDKDHLKDLLGILKDMEYVEEKYEGDSSAKAIYTVSSDTTIDHLPNGQA